MIFVTVGSMLPFDRLIAGMDGWATRHPNQRVFAQIGRGVYEPQHMEWSRKLTPLEFNSSVQQAALTIAHAGMGSVITALELAKPIVLMPRDAARGEHTTDHQLHTARWLQNKPGIYVATTEPELDQMISVAIHSLSTQGVASLPKTAPLDFIAQIRHLITTGKV